MAAGLALIGTSVVLGAWAVTTAADTEPLYALAQDVAPGDDLTAEGVLTVVDSHPGTGSYVRAGQLPDDAVAAQALSAGDLLPGSAVAEGQDLALRAVVLTVSSSLPAGTTTGDVVDLWALPAARTSTEAGAGEAAVVAQGLIVSRVGETGAAILGGTTTSVEVLVPEELVGAVLTAVGQGGPLVLVPTGQLA
ncbi:hypothetical protein H6X68_09905 [Actinomyces sp. 186855]|nr:MULTISPECIES: hypothetical protein [unclassified Actinomyces]MCL3778641.1 hypothetical protein [Actinomyces sp. AC-20-1]MCL3790568.1 hypothetical protein [Actinomyces sp. 187325]MCL3792887.1 hypothetical protein [Actinomyces sp. 186855]MCL3795281.1 hypothetical protein [Actinomyces sp. 217892]